MLTLAIDPFQTGLCRGRTGLIDQLVRLRGGEGGVPDAQVNYDPVNKWDGTSRDGPFFHVEMLGVEGGLVDVE